MIRSTCFGHHYAHQELETVQAFTACDT